MRSARCPLSEWRLARSHPPDPDGWWGVRPPRGLSLGLGDAKRERYVRRINASGVLPTPAASNGDDKARGDSDAAPARRRAARRISLVLVYVVFGLFYFWTATSSVNPIQLGATQNDYYNLLADGFAAGQLSIPEAPAPALLALPDPYDPAETTNLPNADVPHDLSLYHDRFYLSWGPTPVLTLIWPWRLLHLGQLPQNAAALIFSLVGLAFLLLTLDVLLERFFPDVQRWKVTLAQAVLAASNTVPYLLRRPIVYEIAISAAFCFVALSMYLLASGLLRGPPRAMRLALASLCLGAAAGARFNLLILGVPLAILAIQLYRRRADRWRQLLIVLVAPFALVVCALALYNYARFGNPFEIGSYYQLEGYNPQKTPFFQFGYVLPSLYYYLVAPVRPLLAFPYFALAPPPAYPLGVPSTYAVEITGGLLTATPLVGLLLAAPFLLRRRLEPAMRAVLGLLLGSAGLVLLALCISVPGATERYEVDFSSLIVFAAVLCWLSWSPTTRWRRRSAGVLFGLFGLYGAAVGVAVSVTGPDDELQAANPTTYRSLEQATSFIPQVVTTLLGHADIVRVIDPLASYPENLGDYGTSAIGNTRFYLQVPPEEVDIVSPRGERMEMTFGANRTSASLQSGRITITVADPTGTTTVFRFRHLIKAQIALQPGLNRIDLTARASKPLVPGGPQQVVRIHDLRLEPLPAK